MPRHRHALPQLNGQPVITDGGLETVLVFHEQMELPHFCSFPLVREEQGRALLVRYLDDYLAIARRHDVTLLLESATWRASRDWLPRLGFREDEVADINREAIELLAAYRDANADTRLLISGCMGPRGDGYAPGAMMTADEAQGYHAVQVAALADSEADLISALTLNYVEEAIGVALAAKEVGMPCAISFTVEIDGRLPTGQSLGEAIQQTDESTGAAPAYYMINCAHPTHIDNALAEDPPWISRVGGIRANASTKSHEELDAMETLDEGDPTDLGARMSHLKQRLPSLNVLGGCCGTDHRHLAEICRACHPVAD